MAKVLYIDDTENNRILVKRRLERSGYQVLAAGSAKEGLALASSEKPELILMDLGMPDVDGWTATRQLKADPNLQNIPVIALTAHAMQGDQEKAIEAGCDEYETKPFDFARLIQKIQALLDSRKPPPGKTAAS